ncbi:MAG TPA: magnesium transporter CorA family protein [Acidimicrobiales bacterium]|nr:magnesium transporter CorA family protein [Acidimicrobiales bacterium]
MNGHLMTLDSKELEPTTSEVESLLTAGTPFWLDLEADGDECSPQGPVYSLLRDTFQVHELALEDAQHFGQRPKLDTYDNFSLLVAYGPGDSGHLVEMHCFCAKQYLVTVHRTACQAVGEVVKRVRSGAPVSDIPMVLYRVIDCLVDGYFPVLAALDERIDELEDEILQAPTEDQLGQLFDMKRSLIALRKVVTPQRDVFATLLSTDELPGMTPDCEHYFRDVYDHLIRVSDLVDSYRDLMTGALDTHLSTVSNRLNVVMKQLTIIATVFLPLGFLTGFFGQNFAWMVDRLGGLGVFLGVGIGLQVATVVLLVVLFRRRGWLRPDGTVPAAVPARRTRSAPHLRWLAVHPPPTSAGAKATSAKTGKAKRPRAHKASTL